MLPAPATGSYWHQSPSVFQDFHVPVQVAQYRNHEYAKICHEEEILLGLTLQLRLHRVTHYWHRRLPTWEIKWAHARAVSDFLFSHAYGRGFSHTWLRTAQGRHPERLQHGAIWDRPVTEASYSHNECLSSGGEVCDSAMDICETFGNAAGEISVSEEALVPRVLSHMHKCKPLQRTVLKNSVT